MPVKTRRILIAVFGALSTWPSAALAAVDELLVTMPEFETEKYERTARRTEEHIPGAFGPARNFHLYRAKNLLQAGHFAESLSDYKTGMSDWSAPNVHKAVIEREWGIACDKTGDIDGALEHYKAGGAQVELAKLYIRLKQYSDAKKIADLKIVDLREAETRNNHQSGDLPAWYRMRAAIEVQQHNAAAAIQDLQMAATIYRRSTTDASKLCDEEAHAVAAKYDLKLSEFNPPPLPHRNAGRVKDLLKYLLTSEHSLSISKINSVTGSHLKLPGSMWPEISDEDSPAVPFQKIDYRVFTDKPSIPQKVEVTINTSHCSLPMTEVEQEFTINKCVAAEKLAVENKYTCYWKYILPSGNLTLKYSPGGEHVLTKIEFISRREEPVSEIAGNANANEAVGSVVNSESPPALARKALSLAEQNMLPQALVLVKRAVRQGGRPFLLEQSTIEEKIGNLDDAADSLLKFIGNHNPGPETARYFTQLAGLYYSQKNYTASIDASDKAMINSRRTGDALAIKAKAELALNRVEDAKRDATAAVTQYFDEARIMRRDEILKWIETLPTPTVVPDAL